MLREVDVGKIPLDTAGAAALRRALLRSVADDDDEGEDDEGYVRGAVALTNNGADAAVAAAFAAVATFFASERKRAAVSPTGAARGYAVRLPERAFLSCTVKKGDTKKGRVCWRDEAGERRSLSRSETRD